jgi:hypothetical protein
MNGLKIHLAKGVSAAGDMIQKAGAEGAFRRQLLSSAIERPFKVQYFMPGNADGDREGRTFTLPAELAVDQVTLGVVREWFPFEGKFSFRFQHSAPEGRGVLPLRECAWGGFVWVDLHQDSDRVPFYNGQIILKAEQKLTPTAHASVDLLSMHADDAEDLLSLHVDNGEDLIDLNDESPDPVVAQSSPESPVLKGQESPESPVLTAQEYLEAERQRMQMLQQAKLVAESKLQTDLDTWAYTANGSPKDIKVLLSTLHNVIWENSGWTPLEFSDLVANSNSLKDHVKKAILTSHPDKQHNAPADRIYRAERIFQALNKAKKVRQ